MKVKSWQIMQFVRYSYSLISSGLATSSSLGSSFISSASATDMLTAVPRDSSLPFLVVLRTLFDTARLTSGP